MRPRACTEGKIIWLIHDVAHQSASAEVEVKQHVEIVAYKKDVVGIERAADFQADNVVPFRFVEDGGEGTGFRCGYGAVKQFVVGADINIHVVSCVHGYKSYSDA